MKINKKLNTLVFGILAVILLSSYVCAFSLGCLYHKNYPLEISPGETKDIFISLQASTGEGDVTVTGKIIEGSELLEFIDQSDTFVIPAGGEKGVNMKATIPSDTRIGEVYKTQVGFTTVTKTGTGTFGFGTSIVRKFDVVITPAVTEELPEEKFGLATILIILIVAVIIIILIILLIKKRKNRRNKSILKTNKGSAKKIN